MHPREVVHDSSCHCRLCECLTDDTPLMTLRYAPLDNDKRTVAATMKMPGEPESQPDPYPPFSDEEIDRLDKFYADERRGINTNERRLLANIRELKAELVELRASRARLMDPVVDPMNALHEQYCDEQSQLPTEESFEAWVKKHNAARQKV